MVFRGIRNFGQLFVAAFCMAVVLTSTSLVSAEDADTTTAEETPVVIPEGGLSEEALGNLLGAMGLKPNKLQQRYDFDFTAIIEEEDWVLSMSSVLSQDGQSLWVMAWLDELPRSAAEVPRTALLRLLARNDKMGSGKFFTYIPTNRRFVLQRVVANENMTTKKYLGILKDLGRTVVETYPEWSVENWSGNKPAQSPEETNDAPASKTGRTANAPSETATR